jgi:hypothetical protein
MNDTDQASLEKNPHGRGYGHDYMRGGEVLGGYGYAERDEYEKSRGELMETSSQSDAIQLAPDDTDEASRIT